MEDEWGAAVRSSSARASVGWTGTSCGSQLRADGGRMCLTVVNYRLRPVPAAAYDVGFLARVPDFCRGAIDTGTPAAEKCPTPNAAEIKHIRHFTATAYLWRFTCPIHSAWLVENSSICARRATNEICADGRKPALTDHRRSENNQGER